MVTKPAPTAASKGATPSSSGTARPAAWSSTAAWTARGPPQAAQEGLQATCGRTQGRATLQPGTREAGGGLLPDLRSAHT
ncbi:hypothetical protein THAOC_00586, partial [Thalassiosira oceanica]